MPRQCYVYIMASRSRCLYVGVTRDLASRVDQHRRGVFANAFTRRYNVRRLVYFEYTTEVRAARAREKQLKGWSRVKKVALVSRANPGWRDLAERWPEIEMPSAVG